MWYVTVNGKIINTPYETYSEAMHAAMEIKDRMIAVCVDVVRG